MDKLRRMSERIKELGLQAELEVDGGVEPRQRRRMVAAGASVLVAGSSRVQRSGAAGGQRRGPPAAAEEEPEAARGHSPPRPESTGCETGDGTQSAVSSDTEGCMAPGCPKGWLPSLGALLQGSHAAGADLHAYLVVTDGDAWSSGRWATSVRLVRRLEWLTLWPKVTPLPQSDREPIITPLISTRVQFATYRQVPA